jgi:sugar phosphate isomerase/epimerase
MADIFKPRQLNCAMWESHPVADMTRGFGVLCDRAAEKGLLVALEFIPHSGIRDMVVAWEIVKGANRPNGGLIFDTWHFQRGGTSHEAITTVPPEKWFTLQLSDAERVPWPEVREESRRASQDGSARRDADGDRTVRRAAGSSGAEGALVEVAPFSGRGPAQRGLIFIDRGTAARLV